MKRLMFVLLIAGLAISTAGAQDISFEDLNTQFTNFSKDVASSLPLNAQIGSVWSDAHIGQFPRFGVGATVGVTTIPYDTVFNIVDGLGLTADLPAGFTDLANIGIPLPAYTLDARVGGLLLPFDVGAKVGYIGPELGNSVLSALPVNVDYLLAGFDARLNVISEGILLPSVSVGAGYSFLSGSISLPSITNSDIQLASITDPLSSTVYDVSLSSPDLSFQWDSSVITVNAHASKNFFLFTPYAGLGAALGLSSAGGGLESELVVTADGSPATEEQIATLEQYLAQEYPDLDLSGQSILVAAASQGWSFRAYAGTSINLLFLRLDLNASYDLLGEGFGAQVGFRFQI